VVCCGCKTRVRSKPNGYRRAQQISLLVSLCSLVGYLLFSLTVFFSVYSFYRSHSEWRWDFTLFNSPLDAYVLIFVWTFPGAILLLIAHLVVYFVFKRKTSADGVQAGTEGQNEEKWGFCCRSRTRAFRTETRNTSFEEEGEMKNSSRSHDLELPFQEILSPTLTPYQEIMSPTPSEADGKEDRMLIAIPETIPEEEEGKPEPQISRRHFFLHLYLSFTVILLAVTTLIFLAFQVYHCVLFPGFLNVQFISAWNWQTRFRSLNVAFLLLPPTLVAALTNFAHSFWFLPTRK